MSSLHGPKSSADLLINESSRKTKEIPPPLPPRKLSPTATTSGLTRPLRKSFEIKILSQELRQQSTSKGREGRTQSMKEELSGNNFLNFSKLSPDTIQALLEGTPSQVKSNETIISEEDNLLSNVKAIELLWSTECFLSVWWTTFWKQSSTIDVETNRH